MRIQFRGVSSGPALRARIEKRLSLELGRIQASPVAAVVTFVDDNGPKGGRAIRCALTVRVPYRPTIQVEDVAENQWLAFHRSFVSLRRRLAECRERAVERARYPKKYFMAKRLLEA